MNRFVEVIDAVGVYDVLVIEICLICIAMIWFLIRTKEKQAQQLLEEKERLRLSEELYQLVDEFSDGILFDGDFRTDSFRFNQNYRLVFGRDPIIHKISEMLNLPPYVFPEDAEAFLRLGEKINAGESHDSAEYRIIRSDGRVIWHRVEYKIIFDADGEPHRLIGKMSNIDEQKRQIQQLKYQAESDSLTKLLNHQAIADKISDFLSNEGKAGQHAFYIIDIDDLKGINDRFGHYTGDVLIKSFAREISRVFRSSDIIGRLGGDEFVVFVKNAANVDVILSKANDVCRVINALLIAGEPDLRCSCSIGIAIYPDGGSNFSELYENADQSLYYSKNNGKNMFKVYGESIIEES